jgi:chemotaxis response regulator CheB
MTDRPLRVFVADHRVDRLARMCGELARSSDVRMVGIAQDGAEVVRRVWSHRPDVLLMAPTLPRMDAITTLRYLSKLGALPVLMIADATEVEPALDGVGMGARGVVCMDSDEPGDGDRVALLDAVRRVGSDAAESSPSDTFARRVPAGDLAGCTTWLRRSSPTKRHGALVYVDAPDWLVHPLAERWHRATPWRVLVGAPGDPLAPGHCLLVTPSTPLVPDHTDGAPRLARLRVSGVPIGDAWEHAVAERMTTLAKSGI